MGYRSWGMVISDSYDGLARLAPGLIPRAYRAVTPHSAFLIPHSAFHISYGFLTSSALRVRIRRAVLPDGVSKQELIPVTITKSPEL